MKVAYLADKAAPFYLGGYEVRAQKLSAYLGKRHEVRVYTSMETPSLRVGDVEYVKVSPTAFQIDQSGQRSLMHSWLYANCLRSDPFREWDPDAVIIEAIPYAHLTTMSSWVAKTPRFYVLSVNEAWHNYAYGPKLLARPSRWILSGLLRRGIGFSTAVVAISNATAESLRVNYSVGNVETVPMGIDPEAVSAEGIPPSVDRGYDFITVGRLVPIKRVDVFILALAILKRRYDWRGRAAILGGGPLQAELKSLARKLGLESHIDFLGMVPDETKYQTLSNSRIFVLPSEREGFSLATLEAMARGLPAVVAKPSTNEVFGTSDFVHDGISGRYFPVGDSAELARILSTLLRDTELTEALSERARDLALTYTWKNAGLKMENLLNRGLSTDLRAHSHD